MAHRLFLFSLAALMAVGCSQEQTSEKHTTNNLEKKYFIQSKDKQAFSHPIKGFSHEEEDQFVLGKSFFRIPWVEAPAATTARDGLGPLFNANTCIHCHPRNGAGVAIDSKGEMTRSHLLRLSHHHSTNTELLHKNGFEPDSTYGAQISLNGNHNVPAEAKVSVTYETIAGTYPDGTPYQLRKPHYRLTDLAYGPLDQETIVAPRIGLALVGLGLLEAIPEESILTYADPDDLNHDGISGRANYAFDLESNRTKLGRFTWKGAATSVKQQVAAAAHNDMGLSNPLFPSHNCTTKQTACLEEAQKGTHTFDLPQKRLGAITFYMTHLAVPLPREENTQEGEALFKALNCIACHVSSYPTTKGVTIHPYSDLLLHDMGEALADGRSEFLANGNEWRTPPLWGIGLYAKVSGEANYLHDGRARNVEEAILWHGGEAQKAKEAFKQLAKEQREALLRYLNSL